MKTKAIRMYIICALISWVILAGWLNAFSPNILMPCLAQKKPRTITSV